MMTRVNGDLVVNGSLPPKAEGSSNHIAGSHFRTKFAVRTHARGSQPFGRECLAVSESV
jgi:hypothetical protein